LSLSCDGKQEAKMKAQADQHSQVEKLVRADDPVE